MNPPPALFYALCILLPLLATAVAFGLGGWWQRLYALGARLLLGALMLGGGLYKLSDNHLPGLMGPPMNHAFLAEPSLEIFAQFIGVAQLLTGLLLLHDYPRLKWLLYPPADAAALRQLPLRTAPLPVELLWWLGAGVVPAGGLLHAVSLGAMTGTMLLGALLLAGATG